MKKFFHFFVCVSLKIGGFAVIALDQFDLNTVFGGNPFDFFKALLEVFLAHTAQEHRRLSGFCTNLRVSCVARTESGKGKSCGKHCACGRNAHHNLFDQRCEKPHIAKQKVHWECHIRHVPLECGFDFGIEVSFIDAVALFCNLCYKIAQTLHSTVFRTTEAAVTACVDLCCATVHMTALFVHGNNRTLAFNTRDLSLGNGTALIENSIKTNPLLFKICSSQHHTVAANFLVIRGTDVEVNTFKRVIFGKEFFGSLQFGKQRGLGVYCATSV